MQIIVETEQLKQDLLKESKYVHDHFCKNFDSDFCNTLMHIYRCPDLIQVVPNAETRKE